jgi:hypothetical protein
MTSFAIIEKRRRNTAPRRRQCIFVNLTSCHFQIADLIKLNGLKTRVGNWQRVAGHGVTGPKLMFGVGAFSHTDEKFSGFTANIAAYPERITQIRVATLIE